jgi:hypothetical protein
LKFATSGDAQETGNCDSDRDIETAVEEEEGEIKSNETVRSTIPLGIVY